MNRLESLLMKVAIEAPLKQGRWTLTAGIDWRTVHEIRAELDRLGINWHAAHKQVRAIKLERSRAVQAAREKTP